MNQGDLVCNACINRLYTKDNQIKCIKKHDSTNISFHCEDYVPEEYYLQSKTSRFDEDVSAKKVKAVFLFLAAYKIIAMLYVLYNLTTNDSIDILMVFVAMLFMLIDCVFYFYLYKANRLARKFGLALFTIALLFDSINLGTDISVGNFISLVFSAIQLYYIKFNKYYLDYFNTKNNIIYE